MGWHHSRDWLRSAPVSLVRQEQPRFVSMHSRTSAIRSPSSVKTKQYALSSCRPFASVACMRSSTITVWPSAWMLLNSTETSAAKSLGNATARKCAMASRPIMWCVILSATAVALPSGAIHCASGVKPAAMRAGSREANARHASATMSLLVRVVMWALRAGSTADRSARNPARHASSGPAPRAWRALSLSRAAPRSLCRSECPDCGVLPGSPWCPAGLCRRAR